MNHRSSLLRGLWLLAGIAGALLFLSHYQKARLAHLDFVASATETNLSSEAAAASGYAANQRRAVIFGNDAESYSWIANAQESVQQNVWRLHHTHRENAPDGRDLTASSPYRWWLILVGRLDRAFDQSRPIGQAIEQGALSADSWLIVLVVALTLLSLPKIGFGNATWIVVACVFLFPASELFSTGEPQNRGLVAIASLAALLPLVWLPKERSNHWASSAFSGLATALAIWITPAWGAPLGASIFLAELVGILALRYVVPISLQMSPIDGLVWGGSGAIGSLLAYAIDFSPAHLKDARLDLVHPLYALFFITAGMLLAVASLSWSKSRRPLPASAPKTSPATPITDDATKPAPPSKGARALWVMIGAALGVILSALGIHKAVVAHHGPLSIDPWAHRLSAVEPNLLSPNLGIWVAHHNLSAIVWAVLVPVLLIPIGITALFDSTLSIEHRARISPASLVALALFAFAFLHLRWIGLFEVSLVPLFVALQTAPSRSWARWSSLATLVCGCVLGGIAGAQGANPSERTVVSRTEVQALVERDLAEWLTVQAGEAGAIVLAPPNLSAALSHFGGLRIVCSPDAENSSGLTAATHILFSTSQDEAHASVQRRQIAFIVLASWDNFFSDVAQASGLRGEATVLGLMQQWRPPRWLRPIPYPMPQIAGFENERVTVFEVVDVQENAVALSHLGEYFAETSQWPAAEAVSHALETYFVDDFGAAIARIEVDAARGQAMANRTAWAIVQAHLIDGAADTLPWDRRVALATVLAEGKRMPEAKAQLDACLHDADETQLHSLTPLELYRFQSLLRALHLEEPEALRKAAFRRLPVEMRHALGEAGSAP